MTDIFIYGSYTTRDSVDFWPDDMSLTGYVARQSLVSAVSGGDIRGFNLRGIKSTFQKRMIKQDLNGDAIEKVTSALDSGSYVIWDLTDERMGFVELEDERVCTAVAITHNELTRSVDVVSRTNFTDPEFLQKWMNSAKTFGDVLGEKKRRVIVNHTPWARRFNDGQVVKDSDVPTSIYNRILERMTNYLSELGFSVVKLSPEEVKASPNHKWGSAPFHYDDQTYVKMVNRLESCIYSLDYK